MSCDRSVRRGAGHGLALVAVALGLSALGPAACEHGAAGEVQGTEDVGPYDASLPRRLTFFDGDDLTPSVAGDVLIYSRQSDAEPVESASGGREECLAFLPLQGGTLQRRLCPDRLIAQPDMFVDTWFEPALAPDGRRLAFVWQRGTSVSPLAFQDAFLMVTPVESPQDTTGVRVWVNYREEGANPRSANLATRITWVDDHRLWYLATVELIFRVYGGGPLITDTIYQPLALMELDLTSGTSRVVPGGDSAIAYTAAPDGGVWIVRSGDSAALLLLDPATGARSPVGRFSTSVLDLVTVDSAPVAIVSPILGYVTGTLSVTRGGAAIERLDPSSGDLLRVGGFGPPEYRLPGPVRRLAAAGDRRLVAEVERGLVPFGARPDLWLLELPVAPTAATRARAAAGDGFRREQGP